MKVSSLGALLTPCGGGFLPSHCFLPLTVITTTTVMIATLTTFITAAMTQSLCNHMQCCCQCLRIILITLMILMDLMGLKALMTLMDLMELISLILLIDLQARLIVMKVTR